MRRRYEDRGLACLHKFTRYSAGMSWSLTVQCRGRIRPQQHLACDSEGRLGTLIESHAPSPVAVSERAFAWRFDYLIGNSLEVAQCWRQQRGHGLIPIFISGSLPQSRQPNGLAERRQSLSSHARNMLSDVSSGNDVRREAQNGVNYLKVKRADGFPYLSPPAWVRQPGGVYPGRKPGWTQGKTANKAKSLKWP